MPTKSKYAKRSKRSYKKKQQYGAKITGAPRMTRALRVQQNLTRDCRWFKLVTQIRTVPLSNGEFRSLVVPTDVVDCNDFQKWGACWEEFQVLQFKVRYIPVAVGSESLLRVPIPAGPPVPLFLRGNTVSWLDQGEANITPSTIGDIIVRPSARLVNSRRPFMRWSTRPKGNPNWGSFLPDGTVAVDDQWSDSRIKLYGQGFSNPVAPATQLIWYYVMVYFKVVFRGRQQST